MESKQKTRITKKKLSKQESKGEGSDVDRAGPSIVAQLIQQNEAMLQDMKSTRAQVQMQAEHVELIQQAVRNHSHLLHQMDQIQTMTKAGMWNDLELDVSGALKAMSSGVGQYPENQQYDMETVSPQQEPTVTEPDPDNEQWTTSNGQDHVTIEDPNPTHHAAPTSQIGHEPRTAESVGLGDSHEPVSGTEQDENVSKSQNGHQPIHAILENSDEPQVMQNGYPYPSYYGSAQGPWEGNECWTQEQQEQWQATDYAGLKNLDEAHQGMQYGSPYQPYYGPAQAPGEGSQCWTQEQWQAAAMAYQHAQWAANNAYNHQYQQTEDKPS